MSQRRSAGMNERAKAGAVLLAAARATTTTVAMPEQQQQQQRHVVVVAAPPSSSSSSSSSFSFDRSIRQRDEDEERLSESYIHSTTEGGKMSRQMVMSLIQADKLSKANDPATLHARQTAVQQKAMKATMSDEAKRERITNRGKKQLRYDSFCRTVCSFIGPHYSDAFTAACIARISRSLNDIFTSGVVNEAEVVAMWIINHSILEYDADQYVDIATRMGGNIKAMPWSEVMSKLSALTTAVATRCRLMNTTTTTASAASSSSSSSTPTPSTSSHAMSTLSYFNSPVVVVDQRSATSLAAIYNRIDALLVRLNESPFEPSLCAAVVTPLIHIVPVKAANLEAIAGAVIYLMIGVRPDLLKVRSYKRVQIAAERLHVDNNSIPRDVATMLQHERAKPLPSMDATLTAHRGRLFHAWACRLDDRYAADEAVLSSMDDDHDAALAIAAHRSRAVALRRKCHPPDGVPSPEFLSYALQDPKDVLHGVCMDLWRNHLLGDCQVRWPTKDELLMMRPKHTKKQMRIVAIDIKDSVTAAMRRSMPPIQGHDDEYSSTNNKVDYLWQHIRVLASVYLDRLFASSKLFTPDGRLRVWGATQQATTIARVDDQFALAAERCDTTLFAQEHETIAATLIVAAMTHYFSFELRILPADLYKHENDVCRDDTSASTVSICMTKLAEFAAVLDSPKTAVHQLTAAASVMIRRDKRQRRHTDKKGAVVAASTSTSTPQPKAKRRKKEIDFAN